MALNARKHPQMSLFARERWPCSTASGCSCDYSPGRWISMSSWPPQSPQHTTVTFRPNNHNNRLEQPSDPAVEERWSAIPYSSACGIEGPATWLSLGEADAAANQAADDDRSLCWTTDKLDSDMSITGFPQLTCTLQVDKPAVGGLLVARLCDVFPDGQSNLITYGVLNLTHRHGWDSDKVSSLALEVGQPFTITLELHTIGYTIPAGHRLRLAVSSNWWPHVWPSATVVDMRVGSDTRLVLPVYTGTETVDNMNCAKPAIGPSIPCEQLRDASFTIHNDFSDNTHIRTMNYDDGRTVLTDEGVITDHHYQERYTIKEGQPSSAHVDIHHHYQLEWPDCEGGISTQLDTLSQMSADMENFYLHHKLDVTLNGKNFYTRQWSDVIKRQWV